MSIVEECIGPLLDVDEIVVQVLDQGFAATIDGNQVSARPRDNLGLDSLAE